MNINQMFSYHVFIISSQVPIKMQYVTILSISIKRFNTPIFEITTNFMSIDFEICSSCNSVTNGARLLVHRDIDRFGIEWIYIIYLRLQLEEQGTHSILDVLHIQEYILHHSIQIPKINVQNKLVNNRLKLFETNELRYLHRLNLPQEQLLQVRLNQAYCIILPFLLIYLTN